MALADAADRKLNITFGFQRRYAELYRKGKQIVDPGAIGKIRLGHAKFIKSDGSKVAAAPRPRTEREKIEQWGLWKELSVDLIVESNIHSFNSKGRAMRLPNHRGGATQRRATSTRST